ncbi:DUF1887 family CARF protein [Shewanella putrefaciens]|uniref:Card1-like endonuclease domain-containing protein n=1 Tax=unclassified Shewanella TaxID=196818 RepID=UPI002006C16B|nr:MULTISPECIES: DUF1887 family CARF protein [unclassified Shewanella]MCK7629348.1 DUF1887 family CARF protein [Shewanella sp. JNE9-1]MCK7652506.1 DUF1887 family CARF protein [Shewanella sp. JNE4-1]
MKTIHINLVSEQLIPNLISTLGDENCCGVVLVLGDSKFADKADRLENLYKRNQLKVLWRSQGMSSTRLPQLQTQANALIDYLATNHSDCHWVLNATCGTKPMALAFANAFNQQDKQQALVIYTDTEHKEIPLLNPGVDFTLPFKSVLSLDDYLLANGFEYEQAINSDNDAQLQQYAPLTRYLAQQLVGKCQHMLGSLQSMATIAAKDFPQCQIQTMPSVPHGDYAKLYQRLNDEGLLSWDGQCKQITFQSEDACRYLAGRWLEEFTYLTALECGAKEVAMSVTGRWLQDSRNFGSDDVTNEFDVLILHNNQLLTIECKASNWFRQEEHGSKNQDIIHKLDTLSKNLGGLFGSPMLVTAQQLSDAARSRVTYNRFRCCEQATEKSLKKALCAWVGTVG